MAGGHSFYCCDNLMLVACSWAYDKFKQASDCVQGLNSRKPANVNVVPCNSTVDRELESLMHEKTDSVELTSDGRLIGERIEDVVLKDPLAMGADGCLQFAG